MTTITHEYSVYDKQGFIHTLNKIVKRYKARVTLTWGESYDYETFVGGYSPFSGEFVDNKINITKHPVTVDFDFDEFKIDGYSYLGCIKDEMMMGLITIHGNEHLEGRNINDFVSSFETIPCHHCNRRHKRKVGHLFVNDETGEVLVFGSSCAKNYFGINFDRLLKFFERVSISFGNGWDDGYVGAWKDKTFHWQSVAAFSYYWISKEGYLSGTKAKEFERNSTGDWVRSLYQGNEDVLTDEIKREISDMEFPDFDVLHTTEYPVRDHDNLSDFEHNLLVLQEKMRRNMVEYNNYGWIAYMVYNQFFKVDERPARVEYVLPEWAEKGRRVKKGEMDIVAEVSHIHSFNGSYGLTYIYTFVSGNIRYKWFTGNDQNVEVGDMVELVAFSIKDTEDNQYGKSVLITRVNLSKDGKATRTPSGVSRSKPHVSKEDKEYFERMGIDTK